MRSGNWLAVAAVLLAAGTGRAAPIIDPAGDILPTYAGPTAGIAGADVVAADGTFDGSTFVLTARMAGPIAAAPPGTIFVWGINTGTGVLAPFASVGAGNVRFNTTAVVGQNGTATNPLFRGFLFGTDGVGVSIPLAALPASTGFAPQNYTWNLWPRVGTGNNNQITDFAPNNSLAAFSAVPEPASAAVFAAAGLAALARRRWWR